MIIRESPSPRKAGREDINWPPKSPRHAMLSSPSGRKRLQCMSPSPSKRRRLADTKLGGKAESDDEEDEEDEETVQLRLEAIEARLKLKKLQKAKTKISDVTGEGESSRRNPGRARRDSTQQLEKVEVPLSPKPQRARLQPPYSPRRVQLGIDKGLRAEEVSLKKARLDREVDATRSGPSYDATRHNHKSFSARLAESRSHEASRQEKRERIEKGRSEGFGLSLKKTSNDARNVKHPSASNRDNERNQHGRDISKFSPTKMQHRKSNERVAATASSVKKSGAQTFPESEDTEMSEDFERFSGFKLSRRNIDGSSLQTAFKDKTLLSVRKLLKDVTAPNYDPPDVEDDYVVFGIIASKSLPQNHIPAHQTKTNVDPNDESILPQRSKFMAIRLTDLKWEIDLFLFASAFDKFWKLTVGTVIAILNPGIMPPKPHLRDTGQFSLKISSSEDTLLEMGMSKDLKFCKSVKRDGKVCEQWIDGRKTEFCDFHVNLRVEKAKAGRMEINGMANLGMFRSNPKNAKRGGGSGRGSRGRGGFAGGRGRGGGGLSKEGAYYDRSAGEIGYAIPREYSGLINTSHMLDAEDYVQGGLSKAERSRRRLADREKEHNLAKALGNQGSGMGSEYMKTKRGDNDPSKEQEAEEAREEPVDAASLGLIGRNAQAAMLGPSSKKNSRRDGLASVAEPMGWGGAFKRGLLSPSRKENRDVVRKIAPAKEDRAREKETSPAKQARFFLKEKGIRVPGRESNGTPFHAVDDDDDDLDIV